MTGHPEKSLFDEYQETDEGAQQLAAADLASQVVNLINTALHASPLDQRALAAKLGVSEGRVSQVVNGDGNLRIAAAARYLRALGYNVTISAHPVEPDLPELPAPRRRGHNLLGTWVGMRDAAAQFYRYSAATRLFEGAVSKEWGAVLRDIDWASSAATFNVGLTDPIHLFFAGKRDDDDWGMTSEYDTGSRR